MEAKKFGKCVVLAMVLAFALSSVSFAGGGMQYASLKGVKKVNAVIDWRHGKPMTAAFQLKLLHTSYKDLKKMGKNPTYAVIFIGPSVFLISSNMAKFKAEDQKYVKEFKATLSAMAKDGIRFEVCVAALKFLKLDPATIMPEVMKVPNGWVAEMGYQAQGYSFVPIF
jgi:uncharacterized protein